MSLEELEDAGARTLAVEPARKWRNLWRIVGGLNDWIWFWDERELSGRLHPGEHWGLVAWPSRDTAETSAKRLIDAPYLGDDDPMLEHIGAFPDND